MTSRFMLIFAAISGFVFVALGAFGARFKPDVGRGGNGPDSYRA